MIELLEEQVDELRALPIVSRCDPTHVYVKLFPGIEADHDYVIYVHNFIDFEKIKEELNRLQCMVPPRLQRMAPPPAADPWLAMHILTDILIELSKGAPGRG